MPWGRARDVGTAFSWGGVVKTTTLLVLTLSLALLGPTCVAVEGVCYVDGIRYEEGASFPAADGCNTCVCDANGDVSCTAMGCIATCTYEGDTYFAGDAFPSTDGCNTCTCTDDGTVACTEMACV